MDRFMLAELGLAALEEADARRVIGKVYELLELRVGIRVAKVFGPGALAAFNEAAEHHDEDGATRVLEEQLPNYREHAQAEFAALKQEFRERLQVELERDVVKR
jgi:hypothetical protein